MLYLKPIAGLGNRMRAIDSAVSLCQLYGHDLTILWVQNRHFNCPYDALFKQPDVPEVRINIVECPKGYPEQFVWASPNKNKDFIARAKIFLQKAFLSSQLRALSKEIRVLDKSQVLTNDRLRKIYSSHEFEHATNQEMDANFLIRVTPLLRDMLSDTTSNNYISSCYRLHAREGHYGHWPLVDPIHDVVERITHSFHHHTIGLHIRRSDHELARRHSTIEKFVDAMHHAIEQAPETTFFLATDDHLTKEVLQKEFGGKIITNKTKSFDRNRRQSLIDAAIDLYCLSATKQIYGSHHSTFSQIAAEIGGIPQLTIK